MYIFSFFKSIKLIKLIFRYSSIFSKIIFLELAAFDYLSNYLLFLEFSLIYCFLSISLGLKIFLFYSGSEESIVHTSSNIFNNLLWSEREISEMHGIEFLNKCDSRHLLLDFSFNGNPMLKSYSVIGYFEIIYNIVSSKIEYIKLLTSESWKIDNLFDY